MNKEEMKKLKTGDIIRHKGGANGYVVTGNYGGRITAARTVDVTNPGEWEFINAIKEKETRINKITDDMQIFNAGDKIVSIYHNVIRTIEDVRSCFGGVFYDTGEYTYGNCCINFEAALNAMGKDMIVEKRDTESIEIIRRIDYIKEECVNVLFEIKTPNPKESEEELKETVENYTKHKIVELLEENMKLKAENTRLQIIENKVLDKKKRKKIIKNKVKVLQELIKRDRYESDNYRNLHKELRELVGDLHQDVVLLGLGVAQKKGEKAENVKLSEIKESIMKCREFNTNLKYIRMNGKQKEELGLNNVNTIFGLEIIEDARLENDRMFFSECAR